MKNNLYYLIFFLFLFNCSSNKDQIEIDIKAFKNQGNKIVLDGDKSNLEKEINLKKKEPKKNIILIDSIINSKKISQLNIELLKIKKALLIFDVADEKTMIDLLNKNNKQNKFYSLSMKILNDFYISKNEVSKANEIQKLVNEK